MNGRTRIAVLARDLDEFNARLGELGKIFSINLTAQGTALLNGGSEVIEATFIDSGDQAREMQFDGFIVLTHAREHIDFDNIITFLQSFPRSTIRH